MGNFESPSINSRTFAACTGFETEHRVPIRWRVMVGFSSDDMLGLQEAVRMLAAEVRRRVEACSWFQLAKHDTTILLKS